MKKCVFFDRDGTLIIDKDYLNDPEQIEYLPGVFPTLQELKNRGYVFIIVTNQSGVASGRVDPKNLAEINRRIIDRFEKENLPLIDIIEAPYLNTSNHYYRKPRPGMLIEGLKTYEIDPEISWMVGDKMSDIQAGENAGVPSILIDLENQLSQPKPFHKVSQFIELLEYIE